MSVRVLEVEGLKTYFDGASGQARAVNDISFYVDAGEVLALVGESGSGKSMTGYSLLGLVDRPGKIVGGTIRLNGEDISGWSQQAWRTIRGNRIAMIFQDPMMTLNPVLSIETQMVEQVLAHQSVSKRAARTKAQEALERVGIPAAKERLHDYPHQFSGGMRQRVSIAIALLNRPDLIICDEPTTALDVTIQAQIIAEMQQLCIEAGTALIWITHDLSIVAGLADRVAVMYAGRIVETGTTHEVIDAPRHPYTRGLIDSTPAAARSRVGAKGHLVPIPGLTPSLVNLPAGCAFHPRCSHATDICLTEPRQTHEGVTRMYRCFHPLQSDGAVAPDASTLPPGSAA